METMLSSEEAKARHEILDVLNGLVAALERQQKRDMFYASDRFEVSLEGRGYKAWNHDGSIDVNDVRLRMLQRLPRRMHLQLNGNAEGECYAPFLCVHFHLGISYQEFVDVMGDDFGQRMAWGLPGTRSIIHRDRNGLSRHSYVLPKSSWFYIDPSFAIPYWTPGISFVSFIFCIFCTIAYTKVLTLDFWVAPLQRNRLKAQRVRFTVATFDC